MEYTSKEVYEYVSKHTNDPIVDFSLCQDGNIPDAQSG